MSGSHLLASPTPDELGGQSLIEKVAKSTEGWGFVLCVCLLVGESVSCMYL